ncbi:MAG: 7-cyano-7-deazaguanine synthase QueC [Thermodesulfobacteriota bacterium]
MARTVALVSGGLDSCVAAAVAARAGTPAFLHVNYGQRTEARELRAFGEIADHYGAAERLVADIGYLREIGGSALTDESIEVPTGGGGGGGGGVGGGGIPVTYVPFRNAHLLAIAVSWAEVIGAGEVYIGAVEEDAPGYPDCRESFFRAFQEAIKEGTRPGSGIEIRTPLIHMDKARIVRLGMELGAPLGLTWSCYRDSEAACGECDSCVLRLRGFKGAGAADPIPYRR